MRVTINGKGVLQGTTLLDSTSKKPKCHRFSRVPYALPPTGQRRWKKPDPLPASFSYGSRTSPGKYITRSSICPQLRTFGPQAETHDEDCLQLNIWVPIGIPPSNGWPVLFYFHGGFLQFGSNNFDDPSALLSETNVKCIVVSPGYRLGIFGFLSSKELCGEASPVANFGFWDQRLALEWTYENIEYFGGNKNNITVGGLSAGSYATFHQLAYDIGPNANRQIIRRVLQWSNGCGVQPKKLPEVQQQFDNLTDILSIPRSWNSTQKVSALREKTSDELVAAVGVMHQKFFRPISDGGFLSQDLFENIYCGRFGKRMRELGIQTVIGDLTQEFHLYKNSFPPDSYEGLVDRLSWDFPRQVAIAVSSQYKPSNTSQSRSKEEWKDIFGNIYADMQIHSTMRGFIQAIHQELPLSHIHRYRIDWRTESVDKRLPKDLGATHATDLSIWLFGNGDTLTEPEKTLIQKWLQPIGSFIRGEDFQWGTTSVEQVRYLTAAGKIEIKDDEEWENKRLLWDLAEEATRTGDPHFKSKL